MYIDFSYYLANGGVKIGTAEDFAVYEMRAEDSIDAVSFNRLNGMNSADIPDKVKRAMVQLVDLIYSSENEAVVTSESNEGVSRSYAASTQSKTQELCERENAIFATLTNIVINGQKLLYRGV